MSNDDDLTHEAMHAMRSMHEGHNPLRCQKVVDAMNEAGGGDLTIADLFMIAAMLAGKAMSLSAGPLRRSQALALVAHANSKCGELEAQRMQTAEELAGVRPAGTG